MKLKTTLLFPLLLACSNSYAADSIYDGPYLGFNAHYDRAKADTTYEGYGHQSDFTIKTNETSFGVFGGWNKTFPNSLLLGVEATYNNNDLVHDNPRRLSDYSFGPDGPVWHHEFNEFSLERTFAVVSKFGVTHQKTLLYGLAGITFGKFTTNLWSEPDKILQARISETSEYKAGYIIGCGIEQIVYKSISIRAEYSYSDYGKISSEATGIFGTNKYTFDNTLSRYNLGLLYHF